jgi:hypothetical protein
MADDRGQARGLSGKPLGPADVDALREQESLPDRLAEATWKLLTRSRCGKPRLGRSERVGSMGYRRWRRLVSKN